MRFQFTLTEEIAKEEGLRVITKDSFTISQYEQDEIRWYIGLCYLGGDSMCSMEIYNAYVTSRYDLEYIQDEMAEAWDGDWKHWFVKTLRGRNNQVII